MRLAILSDVHGNLPALEAVLRDMQPRSVDALVVAGDFTGGPQVNETIRLLRALPGWTIIGNSDLGLLRHADGQSPPAWSTYRQFALIRWAHGAIDPDCLEWLRSLPEQRVVDIPGTAAIRVVHGSPSSPCEGLHPELEPEPFAQALAQTSEPVLVCGHSHLAWKWERDGRLALNPGAVCGPLDGTVGAQYALLTWQDGHWSAEHRSVPYDLALIREAFHASGLWDEGGPLARLFLRSIETGCNITEDFLAHARRLAQECGDDSGFISDDIWEQAAVAFKDW